ncbi:MAG: beta-lactamase class, partial [Moorella sp. (in: firmicutes)]|nr:beta-lactamase class [Moorella sp. (in: firmicutes)]
MFRRNTLKLLIIFMALVAIITSPLVAWAFNYQVQPGDSLWSIARRFGTSVADLKSSSNLISDVIYPGQNLYIPDGSPSRTPDYTKLQQQIQNYLADKPGTYGIYFKDLATGQSFGINADTPLPAASTVKLPAVLFINSLVDRGILDWQQKLTCNSATDYQGGSGILQFSVHDGDKLTL